MRCGARALLPVLLALTGCDCRGDTGSTSKPDDTSDTSALRAPPVPMVEVHPAIATILVVDWTMTEDADRCWVRYTSPQGDWLDTPALPCAAGAHRQPILGLPADTAVQVALVVEEGGETRRSDTVTASTGALPLAALEPSLDRWEPELGASEPWLLLALERHEGAYYDGPYWQIVLDRDGRVVWYHALDEGLSSTFPQVSRDGGHIVSERVDRFDLAGGQPAVIQRRSLDLTVSTEQLVPGLRFAWDEAPDGAIWYFDREEAGEAWLSRVGPEGTRDRLFDCVAWIADRCTDTWCCEANAVVVEEERGSVLMSLWATDTVLEIDLQTATVRNTWGQLDGAWTTEPPEAGFDLQHYPSFTPDGTLLVSTHVPGHAYQHRMREYEVDDSAEVLREVRSWQVEQALFPQYQGEALRLANGNTLMNFGTAAAIREVTPGGETAWALTWTEPWMLGHMTPIADLYALLAGPVSSSDTPTSTGSGTSSTPKR